MIPIRPIHISASEDKNFEAVIMPVKISNKATRNRNHFYFFLLSVKKYILKISIFILCKIYELLQLSIKIWYNITIK